MKIKLLALMCTAMVLAGCDSDELVNYRSQERERLFHKCLSAIPEGPVKTHNNDWSEVVDSCETHAYYTSQRKELPNVGAAKVGVNTPTNK